MFLGRIEKQHRAAIGYKRLRKNNAKFENEKELIDTSYLFGKNLTNTGASEVPFIPVFPTTKKGYSKVSLMYKSIIYVNVFLQIIINIYINVVYFTSRYKNIKHNYLELLHIAITRSN